MKAPSGTFSQVVQKSRRLESHAFFLGAHNVDAETALREIEARFTQETSSEKAEPLRKLHSLEAKLQQVRKERPEAEAVWTRVRKELGDTPPPYFQAILMACGALFALLLDTLFLAPTMDILNIASPVLQYLAAFGFAALCTAYFEIVGVVYIDAVKSLPKRLTAVAIGGIGVFFLIAWGLLRGLQLRFAAGLAGNPLGQFLSEHPGLAALFYIFVTLATPIIGATALLLGWTEVSRAHTWRRVRHHFENLRASEIQLARDVETEQEHLAEFDKRKAAECLEWRAIFTQFYKRGQQIGARQETLWSILRKTTLGVLAACPIALLVPWAFFPVQLGIPAVAGLAAFVYFNHRRHHPSHERYLAQENTRFAFIPDAPESREIRAPQQHLLTKGEDSNDREN